MFIWSEQLSLPPHPMFIWCLYRTGNFRNTKKKELEIRFLPVLLCHWGLNRAQREYFVLLCSCICCIIKLIHGNTVKPKLWYEVMFPFIPPPPFCYISIWNGKWRHWKLNGKLTYNDLSVLDNLVSVGFYY